MDSNTRMGLPLDPLNKLPAEAATELKSAFFNTAWQMANIRKDCKDDANNNQSVHKQHWEKFCKLMEGWLDEGLLRDLNLYSNRKAWQTANTRYGYAEDAENDEKLCDQIGAKIKNSGKLTETLADDIMNMSNSACWHAANESVGYTDDAQKDMQSFESTAAAIACEPKIKRMTFKTDQAQLGSVKPMVCASQILDNEHSAVQQSMTMSFTKSEGQTHSTSTNLNFSTKVGTAFKAGFPCLAESKVSVELSFGAGQTFSDGASTTMTKSYSCPVQVPAGKKYEAKAVIQEAEMNIPYELVLDFGGQEVRTTGMWSGVTSSQIEYEVHEVQ